jgi:NADP-dependent 3-hydroxy acid dehydrogenase YdfG
MELNGRVVLVTGGGSGIGLGVAVALAREGCQVAICGRDEQKLAAAAGRFSGSPSIIYRSCDVSDRRSVGQLVAWTVEQLGPIDVLVTSAGINVVNRSMEKLDPADWDRIVAINATGTYNCMYAVLPSMRERRTGLIVNISSIAGKRALMLAGPAYAASKFAATALGTAVGQEIKADGVRVTNIYPGEVNTPILDRRPEPVPDERKARMVHPEDIGAMVVAIAKLPNHVQVPELVITPLYQDYV